MLKSVKLWITVATSFLLLIAFAAGILLLNAKVPVPPVVGQTLTEATTVLEKAGLKVEYLEEFSSTAAKGIVISQDIDEETKLKKGSVVMLLVSAGVEQVAVPKVKNDTLEQAEEKLEELGFTVAVTEEFSDKVEKGSVVSQSVQSGKEIDKGSEITIVISKGPDLVEVPELTGKTLEEATEALSLAGFKIKSDIQCSRKVKEGLIISQDIAPGEMLKRHSEISVLVSAGVANTVGNSNANSRNSGIVTAQGNWIYYSNMNNNYYLYKMRKDGTEKQIVTRDHVCNINVVGEWIYYTNESDSSSLYKIRLDGSKRTKLNSESSYGIHVVGEWVYYVRAGTDLHLYKIKTDGSEKTLLSSDACAHVNVEGDWIYYQNYSDSLIYKIRTDGSDKTLVHSELQGNDLNVADGVLYSTGMYSIEKINTDSSGRQSYDNSKKQISFINVSDGWIYFLEHDFSYGIDHIKTAFCKMRIDGTGKSEILQLQYLGKPNFYLNVVDDWIYFPKEDDNCYLYRVRTDGSDLQKMY